MTATQSGTPAVHSRVTEGAQETVRAWPLVRPLAAPQPKTKPGRTSVRRPGGWESGGGSAAGARAAEQAVDGGLPAAAPAWGPTPSGDVPGPGGY